MLGLCGLSIWLHAIQICSMYSLTAEVNAYHNRAAFRLDAGSVSDHGSARDLSRLLEWTRGCRHDAPLQSPPISMAHVFICC